MTRFFSVEPAGASQQLVGVRVHNRVGSAVHSKRNPKVFNGKFISVTRQDDGTYRLNFKPMPKLGANLSIERYTFGVYLELHKALEGLIGK